MEALNQRITGQTLERILVTSPFLLRSVSPPLRYAESKKVHELRRTGKRIAIGLDDDLWLVLHLMIAGRLHWRERRDSPTPRALAFFDFSNGRLWLTEAGTQRRASPHLGTGEGRPPALHPSGLGGLGADPQQINAGARAAHNNPQPAPPEPPLLNRNS